MLRRVLSIGLPVACAAFSCAPGGGHDDAPNVLVATNLTLPKGVLDHVTKLTLTVQEGAITCNEASGQTSVADGAPPPTEIARSELATTGCAPGVRFCGDVRIEKSDAVRVFSAVATGEAEATLAIGCAQATVDQDALPVSIKMFRFLAPANCTDSVLQPTEQCVKPVAAFCDDTCQTKELLLSTASSTTKTQDGVAGDKTNPFLLWPPASGTQGRFFAFYTDRAVTGSNNVEVALRAMTDELAPIAASESPALSAGSIYLPNGPTFPPDPSPRQQSAPQAAFLKGKYYVAFQDDTGVPATGQDIHIRSMDGALVADQGATPLGVNGGPAGVSGTAGAGAGEAAIQGSPAIAAGPSDRLFIAWEDAAQGKIAGRTLSPPGTLGNQNDISTGTGNTGVSVAATTTGWVAVWQSGTGVKLRAVNEDGTPQGSDLTVNDGGTTTERPRVASLPDGRFAVTWSAGGDIFVQRYDAKGAKIAGDQPTPINDPSSAGDQVTPSIAATPAAGGSYVVVWLDTSSSHVRGRMLGGSTGFLFNNVNGQSTDFQASRTESRTRANPTVTVGGSGPFVAIAWEDKSSPGFGIVARRFPLPSD